MTREQAEQELVEGYLDGRNADNPEPSSNRSLSYRHGFQSGRDDLSRKPSAPYADRVWMAESSILQDIGAAIPGQPA